MNGEWKTLAIVSSYSIAEARLKALNVFADPLIVMDLTLWTHSDDVVKRNAIRDSGEYLVWTLTWHDLVNPDAKHLKEVFGLNRMEVKQKESHYPLFNSRNYETLRNVYDGKNVSVHQQTIDNKA